MGGREMEHGVEVGCESSLLSVGAHACAGRTPWCPRAANAGVAGMSGGRTEKRREQGPGPPTVTPVCCLFSLSLSLTCVCAHTHAHALTHTHLLISPSSPLPPFSQVTTQSMLHRTMSLTWGRVGGRRF